LLGGPRGGGVAAFLGRVARRSQLRSGPQPSAPGSCPARATPRAARAGPCPLAHAGRGAGACTAAGKVLATGV